MRTRVVLGVAALLGALLAALVNGWTPRSGLQWPIDRGSVAAASVIHPAATDRAPLTAANTNTPDFTVRARAALAMSRDRKRSDALQAIIAEWIVADPLACLAFLEEAAANDPMRVSLSNFAIEHWLAFDEMRAREWVLARVRSDGRASECYLRPISPLRNDEAVSRGCWSCLATCLRPTTSTPRSPASSPARLS